MSIWWVMDVSDESDIDSVDDLASFEVVKLSSPALLDDGEEAEGHVQQSKQKIKLKTKLLSAWNRVKYRGWSMKTKPRLSKNSPVHLLGESYQLSYSGERESFRRAFSSLLWLTYRRGFVRLDGSTLSSDAGWGCMLRSAQMLLAQGLQRHVMPAGWTWPAAHHHTRDDLEVVDSHELEESCSGAGKPRRRSLDMMLSAEEREERAHRRLVSWFGDLPSAPFGLHRLVELGHACGKRAGDWYGPSIVSHILQKAVSVSELLNLVVYVAQDCTVYIGDVLDVCGVSGVGVSVDCRWKSLILLVPVRLGGDALNPAYTKCVKRLLMLSCCIGIIGGKPKRSLFFVGFQDDHLLCLDPHYCQTAVDVTRERFPLESFHCKTVRKTPFSGMDPSCTLGFYAGSREDFQTLCSDVTMALTSSEEKYPIFMFVEGRAEVEVGCNSASVASIKTKDRRKQKRSSPEEFVLL